MSNAGQAYLICLTSHDATGLLSLRIPNLLFPAIERNNRPPTIAFAGLRADAWHRYFFSYFL